MFTLSSQLEAAASPPAKATAVRVIIDPGHGGKDRGAVRGKVRESKVALEVSQKLAAILQKDSRFNVSLTRSHDRTLRLSDRAKFARLGKGDLFISIHANSSVDRRAKGVEIYFQNQLPSDEESMFLANKENLGEGPREELSWPLKPIKGAKKLKPDVVNILRDLQRNYRLRTSGELAKAIASNWSGNKRAKRHSVRQAPFYVVSNVNMPSILVELGFLTNSQEARMLTSKTYQHKVARGIYNGILHFKESMDNSEVSRLD